MASSQTSSRRSLNEEIFRAINKKEVSQEKRVKWIESKLQSGADINAVDKIDKGNTVLHIAVINNFLHVVKFLLQQPNINCDVTNNDGVTPLQLVKSKDMLEIFTDYVDVDITEVMHQDIENPIVISETNNVCAQSDPPNVTDVDLVTDNIIEEYKKDGLSKTFHGVLFQINLTMLFIKRAMSNSLEFRLATEMKAAGKFDDIIIEFKKNNEWVTRLVQAKHYLQGSCKDITSQDLCRPSLGRFNRKLGLEIYFKSFLDIKETVEFEGKEVEYYICTNIKFDDYELLNAGFILKKLNKVDDILQLDADLYQLDIDDTIDTASLLYKSLIRIYEENNLSELHGIDATDIINNFLSNLFYAVGLPTQNEVLNIVEKELAEENEFILSSDNRFLNSFRSDIIGWIEEIKGTYLTNVKCNALFESIKSKYSRSACALLTARCIKDLNRHGIEFQIWNYLEKYLQDGNHSTDNLESHCDTKLQILNVVSSSTELTSIKVYHSIQALHSNYESYVLINSTMLDSITFDHITQVFNNFDTCKVFVITIDNNDGKQLVEHFLHCALKDFEKKSSKIILITDKKRALNVNITQHSAYIETSDNFSLHDLTETSQRSTMLKQVIFQGWPVCLGEVIKKNYDLVDSKCFLNLVHSSISVGNDIKTPQIPSHYIERSFFNPEVITDNFFIKNNIDEMSSFHGSINNEVPGMRFSIKPSDRPRYYSNSLNKYVCKLSENNSSRIQQFIVHEGYNSNKQPRNPDISSEIQILKKNQLNRLIIISAAAGTGKSTVLSSLQHKMKTFDRHLLWVAKIELNDHTQALQDIEDGKEFSKEYAVDFLAQQLLKLSGFSLQLFVKYCTMIGKEVPQGHKNEGRVILMFDGFDEISPTYKNKVIQLMQGLLLSNIQQIWITTRPNMKQLLEDEFRVSALILKDFTTAEQETFLVRYWHSSLGLQQSLLKRGEHNKRIRKFAIAVVHKVALSLSSRNTEFTGNPLHVRMLAEIFEVQAKEIYESNAECLPMLEVNLIELFETFVKKKFEIYMEEKLKTDNSKVGMKYLQKSCYEQFIKDHQQLAFHMLFNTHELYEELLQEAEILVQRRNTEEEKSGIIEGVVDGKARFIHRTFAEYFSATFITSRAFDKPNLWSLLVETILVQQEYKVLRSFLNDLVDCIEKIPQFIEFVKLGLQNNFERTCLHVACFERNISIIKLLMRSIKSSFILQSFLEFKTNEAGNTALHVAANVGYTDIVRLLVNKGLNVTNTNFANETPLHLACKHGHIEIVEILLMEDHNVEPLTGDGNTPLHIASNFGQPHILHLLLQKGANVNATNKGKETALHFAAKSGHSDCVNCLIRNKADNTAVDIFQNTSLHVASKWGHVEVVHVLLQTMTNYLNLKNKNYETPLALAVEQQQINVVMYLLHEGASTDCQAGGNSLLHLAAKHTSIKIAELLISKKANVRAINHNGDTVLHAASERDNPDFFRFLIREGADYTHRNYDGNTVLHLLAEKGHIKTINLLTDMGLDINVRNKNGKTALDVAKLNGDKKVISILNKWNYIIDVNRVSTGQESQEKVKNLGRGSRKSRKSHEFYLDD